MKKLIAFVLLVGCLSAHGAVTQLNVMGFGARGNGIADDTAALQAAFSAASNKLCSVYMPAGTYLASTLDVSGVAMIVGEGGSYRQATVIKHKLGATNDLITFGSATYRPVIKDVIFQGRREQNLRNMRTITGVTSRQVFTVNTAPPDASYTREAFFFLSDANGYHYLGSGMVSSIVGTTVTLAGYQDWFANPTAAGDKLTTACVVCFGERVTESSITVSDPTRAGYSAINLTGIGAYLKLQNCRFEDWHCDIRVGAAVALDTVSGSTFHRAFSLAAIYCPFGAGSDHRIGDLEAGGAYAAQSGITDTATALTNSDDRCGKFGVSLSGTAVTANKLQIYTTQRGIMAYYCRPLNVTVADIGSTRREAVVVDNSSEVNIGALWAYNIGKAADDTYPVLLNSDGNVSIGNANSFNLAPWAQKASSLIKSTTTSAHNRIGHVASISGCTELEERLSSLSYIDSYGYGEDFVSGREYTGGLWTYLDGNSAYGMKMDWNGGANPFVLEFHAGDKTTSIMNITSGSRVGIGTIPLNYKFEVNGDASVNGNLIPVTIRMSKLTGALVPAVNPAGGIWFCSTNLAGVTAFAAQYPEGEKVYITDRNGDIWLRNAWVTNVASVYEARLGSAFVTNNVEAASFEASGGGIAGNAYYPDASWRRRTAGYAYYLQLLPGTSSLVLNVADTDVQDSVITWNPALTIDAATGNVSIPQNLDVTGPITTPTLNMDTLNVDTIGVTNSITASNLFLSAIPAITTTNTEFTVKANGQTSLRLFGTNWVDSFVPQTSVRPGATAPSLANFNGGPAQVYMFNNAQDDVCEFSVQLNHNFKPGPISPHVHFARTAATGAGNGVVWQLVYSVGSPGSVFAGYQTLLSTNTIAGADWTHQLAGFEHIDGSSWGVSTILVCRLTRLANTAPDDTYDQDIAFLGFDIHYQANSIGSDGETSKSP